MIEDQAAINAGFDFRRFAMKVKPTPAKPRSIIAHVEGSVEAAAAESPNLVFNINTS
jgi:hypothetical protein